MLTVRNFTPIRQPVRVVAAAQLDLPRERLAASVPEAPLWLVHGPDALAEARTFWRGTGADLVEIPATDRGLDPAELLNALGARGLTRVFCEGGGQFAAALMHAGLVDELIGFTAGVVLGGDGRAALGALGLDRLAEAPCYRLVETEVIGGDILHRWRRG